MPSNITSDNRTDNSISSADRLAFFDSERMLTIAEVVTLLGLSRTTIYVHISSGELTPMRVSTGKVPGIRFRRGDVLAFRDRMMERANSSPEEAA